jgi:hypothetical protein
LEDLHINNGKDDKREKGGNMVERKKKKGWKKLEGLYVGESFAPNTFWIFRP